MQILMLIHAGKILVQGIASAEAWVCIFITNDFLSRDPEGFLESLR